MPSAPIRVYGGLLAINSLLLIAAYWRWLAFGLQIPHTPDEGTFYVSELFLPAVCSIVCGVEMTLVRPWVQERPLRSLMTILFAVSSLPLAIGFANPGLTIAMHFVYDFTRIPFVLAGVGPASDRISYFIAWALGAMLISALVGGLFARSYRFIDSISWRGFAAAFGAACCIFYGPLMVVIILALVLSSFRRQ